jgi:hypothetical protein
MMVTIGSDMSPEAETGSDPTGVTLSAMESIQFVPRIPQASGRHSEACPVFTPIGQSHEWPIRLAMRESRPVLLWLYNTGRWANSGPSNRVLST